MAGVPPKQGDVYISDPSPLTGARELLVVVSSDVYNAAGGPTVQFAEIETGTRLRASAYAVETDFGVVLCDRMVYYPLDMAGEFFGQITDAQREEIRRKIRKITE